MVGARDHSATPAAHVRAYLCHRVGRAHQGFRPTPLKLNTSTGVPSVPASGRHSEAETTPGSN
ncbi:MAG: hypothetical protein QOJ06_3116, partial [Pseudonocardiales bacterium]|nr:hypothetical protein [Pseudonocardiales bacterium]